MKTLSTIFFVFMCIAFTNAQMNYFEWLQNSENYWNSQPVLRETQGSGFKQFTRAKAFAERRIDENGSFKNYEKARSNSLNAQNSTTSLANSGNWSFWGPKGIPTGVEQTGKGWIWSVSANPNDHNIIYAGAHHGGVWRTTNGGNSWQPLTDSYSKITGVISLVVIYGATTATDIIYAATAYSESDDFGYSNGVFKSIDGGAHWVSINTGDLDKYDPNNPETNFLDFSYSPRKLTKDPDNKAFFKNV